MDLLRTTLPRIGAFRLSALPAVACAIGLTAACSVRDRAEPFDDGASACAGTPAMPAEARLLTRSEYQRTIVDLFETELEPTSRFPAEPVVDGFDNDASSHQANPLLVENFASAATALAEEARERGFDKLYSCGEGVVGKDCAHAFIEHFGEKVYRRPLSDEETNAYLRLYDRTAPSFSHEDALTSIVEVMLQAPQFLYRVEAPITEAEGTKVLLGPFEMASRLSYFLWGSMPDEELLEAAKSGNLATAAQVEEQARRLIQSEKAKSRIREFHTQWLDLGRLSSVARDDAPEGAPEAWTESMLRYLDSVFWFEGSRVHNLYSSSRIYVNPTLAELYDIEKEYPEKYWEKIEGVSSRHGLLTQPGLMALLAHADQSSPIQRGVFIREKLLCEHVEPPPPTVNNNPPDPDPNLTTRERFAVHTESPSCAKCHELIDPLGFGFEKYDHLGRFREEENGKAIDSSGGLVELTETALEGDFDGAGELAERVASSETVLNCLANRWFTFALGRALTDDDSCSVENAVEHSRSEGGEMRELLVALCASDAFRYRAAHEADGKAEP